VGGYFLACGREQGLSAVIVQAVDFTFMILAILGFNIHTRKKKKRTLTFMGCL
jgi:hypothetical protein